MILLLVYLWFGVNILSDRCKVLLQGYDDDDKSGIGNSMFPELCWALA